MANIDKELRDIKNAVYGREVRGSIHDGIKKINDESEESKAKADEAHDVMEAIMEEGFDNAALESNFAQKLDDKIANLQPEWTGFKEDITTQLADIEQQKADKSEVNNLANDKADLTYVDGKIGSINEKIDNLDGLEFKGAFDTLNDLETMYPNGGIGLYIIQSDNHWYYWNPVTTKWTKGNELTTTPWSEFMTTDGEPWEVS